MLELIIYCAIVAFMELDTTYLGQVLISRPVVVGSLLGFVTGDFFLGLQIGIFTELIYLDFMPIGGVVPPSGAVSTGVAILMAHFFRMDIYFAFFFGIVSGIVFSFIDKHMRKYRAQLLPSIEKNIIEGKTTPWRVLLQSLTLQYLVVLTFLILTLTVAGPGFNAVSADIPEKLHIAFKFSYFVVPWVGLSVLFISFSSKPKAD